MLQNDASVSYSGLGQAPRSSAALLSPVRWLLFGACLLTASAFVVFSWRWKLMGNPPLMHYVVFLLHRGLRPYSEITDSNMPGSYLIQGAAIKVFGASDLSWRVFEDFLMGVMAAAMIVIARRWDWLAGAYAAALFIALHGGEGPEYAGERDLIAAVALLVATACLLESLERHRPAWMLGAGVGWGLAVSIKPTFLGFPAGLALLVVYLCLRRGERPGEYLRWAAAGLSLPLLIALIFLLHFGVLTNFLQLFTQALPAYRRMPGGAQGWIGVRALPRRTLVLILPALAFWLSWLRQSSSRDWRYGVLLASAGFGLLSFLAQGKGFVYHRYAFVMFALLLSALLVVPLLRAPGWRSWGAALTALAVLAIVLPHAWNDMRVLGTQSDLAVSFQSDLEALGGAAQLQRKVQCMDLSYGCLNALYHLRIVENSGFTGDMMFFRREPSPMRELSRRVFWERAQQDPASVLMISNQNFSQDDGFHKLDHWPEFVEYLGANYVQVAERHFEHEHFGGRFRDPVMFADQDAYRLYIRRGSPLLARTTSLHQRLDEALAGLPPSH